VAGDRFATGLLRQINSNTQIGSLSCPFCSRRMRVFQSADPPLELDACRTCGAVWFDPAEFEIIPEGAVPSEHEARMRAIESYALERLEESDRQAAMDAEPDATWKTIPGLFGFPVEADEVETARLPWFTWLLALIIALVSIRAFSNLGAAVERLGFVPAQAARLGGLTFITSFFLHGGWWHLIGNLYFLHIFGDNVEDRLGRWRYALLLLTATITGDLVHLLASPDSTVPCIGASGGISGVIVFYALRFPRARLSFLLGRCYAWYPSLGWGWGWFHMPAWVALVIWLLMQGVGALQELSGFGNVAATSHLGGAAAGLALWIGWRKR
jgi:membrane associated rhomboid family serine protease